MSLAKDLTNLAPYSSWWAVPDRATFAANLAKELPRLRQVPSTGHLLFQVPPSSERMTRPKGERGET